MSVMSLTGLSSSAHTVAQSLLQSRPTAAAAASSTEGTSASGSASGAATNDITSNDFLSLLVTEMKNQDPTQPTDPNAYIQQLVGVNSLQELISINQTLSADASSGADGAAVNAVNKS